MLALCSEWNVYPKAPPTLQNKPHLPVTATNNENNTQNPLKERPEREEGVDYDLDVECETDGTTSIMEHVEANFP